MPSFSYTAVNEDGDELSGTLTAAGKREATQALQDLHLTPKEVVEIGGTTIPVAAVPTMRTAPSATPVPSEKKETSSVAQSLSSIKRYAPLLDTLRLYAGWLLAWYAVVVALGYYVRVRELPFSIPFVSNLFGSVLVFNLLVATFLFLLVSSTVRSLKGGALTGAIGGVLGIALFVLITTQF